MRLQLSSIICSSPNNLVLRPSCSAGVTECHCSQRYPCSGSTADAIINAGLSKFKSVVGLDDAIPGGGDSGTGTVALHNSTDCIHFLIICCDSLMDGILKRSFFSNLVPRGTNKTETYYSRLRPKPRHQGSRPRQLKWRLEAR